MTATLEKNIKALDKRETTEHNQRNTRDVAGNQGINTPNLSPCREANEVPKFSTPLEEESRNALLQKPEVSVNPYTCRQKSKRSREEITAQRKRARTVRTAKREFQWAASNLADEQCGRRANPEFLPIENLKAIDNARTAYHNRRTAEINAGVLDKGDWERVIAKFGNICLRCHDHRDVTMDHIIPISKGGKNVFENLQPLCRSCNSWKGVRTIDFRPNFSSGGGK